MMPSSDLQIFEFNPAYSHNKRGLAPQRRQVLRLERYIKGFCPIKESS
jgi:hypothetical protein